MVGQHWDWRRWGMGIGWLLLSLFCLVAIRRWPGSLFARVIGFVTVASIIYCWAYVVWRFFSAVREERADKLKATRSARGLCLECGYDLRASNGLCPECGTVPNQLPAG